MNTTYELIQWKDCKEIHERARKEGWISECYYGESMTGESTMETSYFIPKYRIDSQEKVKRENFAQHLLIYQLGMVGKTKINIIDCDTWRFDWTLTSAQYSEFKKYAIELLRKVFKTNKLKAEGTFEFFYNNFGLRIKG